MSKILYLNKNVSTNEKPKRKWIGVINLFHVLIKQKPKQEREPSPQRSTSPSRPTNPLACTPTRELANFHEMPRWRKHSVGEYGPDIGLGVQYAYGDPRRYGIDPSRIMSIRVKPKEPCVEKSEIPESQTPISESESIPIEPNPLHQTSPKAEVISLKVSDLYHPYILNERRTILIQQRPKRIKEVLLPKKHYHQSPA